MRATTSQDHILLGYFATILVALMVADRIGEWADGLNLLAPVVALGPTPTALATSMMFFAICVLNPAAAILNGANLRGLGLRFLTGLTFGAALQLAVITPFVGEALARFAMLFVAALGVPVIMVWTAFKTRQATISTDVPNSAEEQL